MSNLVTLYCKHRTTFHSEHLVTLEKAKVPLKCFEGKWPQSVIGKSWIN